MYYNIVSQGVQREMCKEKREKVKLFVFNADIFGMGIRISGSRPNYLLSWLPIFIGHNDKRKEAIEDRAKALIAQGKIIDGFRLLCRLADGGSFGKDREAAMDTFTEVAEELILYWQKPGNKRIEELAQLFEAEGQEVAAAMLRLNSPQKEDPDAEEKNLAAAQTLIDLGDSEVLIYLHSTATKAEKRQNSLYARKCWEAIAWAGLNACEDGERKAIAKMRDFLLKIDQPLAAAIVWLY